MPCPVASSHERFNDERFKPLGSGSRRSHLVAPGRDRYIFRDGLGEKGELPPADWTSIFGGPAWEPVGDGQWYLHNFAVEQPDLNWHNPEVHEGFKETFRFWADRGVDGFRIDVAHGIAKDLPEVLPSQAELDALPKDGTHPMWDRDDVHEIYKEWRAVFNEYTPHRRGRGLGGARPPSRLRVRPGPGPGL